MANTAAVSVQIDPELKKNAESILSQLGITPSSAIQMLYSQVILSGGLPFQPCLPCRLNTVLQNLPGKAFLSVFICCQN